jgi:leader peptidase (prepilin peptidase)/N-methyltransferase
MMPPVPEPFFSVVVVFVGLVLGSFLNVCIYRLPRGESVVHPRSRCPACGELIRWYQNVPIVSWILLRARCARCGCPISWRYPLVELMTAGILLALWLTLGPTRAFVVAAPFCLAMIVLFFTDLDLQLLPDAITWPGIAIGIAVAWINPFLGQAAPLAGLWMAVSGAALGAGVLWGIGALYGRLRGVEAMGLGDVKLMAMVGAFTGPFGVLFTLFAASTVGAVVGVALIPLRGRSLSDTLPFGCFLAPAAVVAMLYGRQAIGIYFDLVLGRM